MMKNNILDVTCKKTVNVSMAVALWNYWDHEHLDVVHEGYKESNIMYDRDNFMFRVDEIRIPVPFIPFLKLTTPIFMVQDDANTLYTFAVQLGIVSKTTIVIEELEIDKCAITMRYQFDLKGWRIILKPVLKKLIPIWNQRVWDEDLPVKMRRQKVLRHNFKDFVGLPKKIKDRVNDEPINLNLPVRRVENSSRDKHVFSKKTAS
jgi:hypothetical protein